MKTNPELMELQQRIWAYEWIEYGLSHLEQANHDFWFAMHWVQRALECFYQAAHRLWWAHKFKHMRKE
jgi:hypothetical protein